VRQSKLARALPGSQRWGLYPCAHRVPGPSVSRRSGRGTFIRGRTVKLEIYTRYAQAPRRRELLATYEGTYARENAHALSPFSRTCCPLHASRIKIGARPSRDGERTDRSEPAREGGGERLEREQSSDRPREDARAETPAQTHGLLEHQGRRGEQPAGAWSGGERRVARGRASCDTRADTRPSRAPAAERRAASR
jgi:hypothetical protein